MEPIAASMHLPRAAVQQETPLMMPTKLTISFSFCLISFPLLSAVPKHRMFFKYPSAQHTSAQCVLLFCLAVYISDVPVCECVCVRVQGAVAPPPPPLAAAAAKKGSSGIVIGIAVAVALAVLGKSHTDSPSQDYCKVLQCSLSFLCFLTV